MASVAAGGAAVGFTPSEGDLKGIIELMNMAQSPDNQVQKQVFQQLEQLEQNPQFTLYLTFILCQCTDEQVGVMNRWRAGTLLKTTLGKSNKRIFQQLPQHFRAYIMENALGALGDSNKNIRRVAGSIVTTALNTEQNEPLSKWFLCRIKIMVVNFPALTNSSRFDKACKNGEDEMSAEALASCFGLFDF
eukprot:Stramenopile-MAST_4_protein_5526